MAKKRRKGSRQANLEIAMRRIQNGMADAKPTSPVFVYAKDRIVKLTRAAYDDLEAQAEDLTALSGWPVGVAELLPKRKWRRKRSHKGKGAASRKTPPIAKTTRS
jgi:hypothetical protein